MPVPACPVCHTRVDPEFDGGLFSIRCAACGWEVNGTANSPALFGDMPPAQRMPVMSAKVEGRASASVLKLVRDTFEEAQRLPLNALAEQLTSEAGLLVGTLQAYRLAEVEPLMRNVGVQLVRVPHEEDR